jgi:hypothetical protein
MVITGGLALVFELTIPNRLAMTMICPFHLVVEPGAPEVGSVTVVAVTAAAVPVA